MLEVVLQSPARVSTAHVPYRTTWRGMSRKKAWRAWGMVDIISVTPQVMNLSLRPHTAWPMLLFGILGFAFQVPAQTADPGTAWHYQLLDGSQSVDDCPVCDRIPIVLPLRGGFDLRCLGNYPMFSRYALENVAFFTTATNGSQYTMSGYGLLEIGGQLASRQTVFLQLQISNGYATNACSFSNTNLIATRRWPMLQLSLEQTNGTITQQYHLELNLAPFQEIWFSCVQGFEAGIWNAPTNAVSDGDLLCATGRVVKRNSSLASRLGVMPPTPELGLKDFDIMPGGEIAFSIEKDVFSESLGQLNHGDVLTDKGVLFKSYQALLSRFEPQDVPPGALGLDALKLSAGADIWFSVQTNFQSKTLNRLVGAGDILSATSGTIFKSNAELLAALGPVKGTGDVGLRAFFYWPSGETWFVPENKFSSTNGVSYGAGDLLSDQGYVVFRASELVSAFAPKPGVQDPEADAVYVVTDVASSQPPPRLATPQFTNSSPPVIVLNWQGAGRVFQLESTTNLGVPFLPSGPLSTETSFFEQVLETNRPISFYRVRQW